MQKEVLACSSFFLCWGEFFCEFFTWRSGCCMINRTAEIPFPIYLVGAAVAGFGLGLCAKALLTTQKVDKVVFTLTESGDVTLNVPSKSMPSLAFFFSRIFLGPDSVEEFKGVWKRALADASSAEELPPRKRPHQDLLTNESN